MLLKYEDGQMGLVERGWHEGKMFTREKIESRKGWVQRSSCFGEKMILARTCHLLAIASFCILGRSSDMNIVGKGMGVKKRDLESM
jgi:hypothetical protein